MNLTSYFSELSLIALQTGVIMLLHRVVSGLKIIYVKHLEHTGLEVLELLLMRRPHSSILSWRGALPPPRKQAESNAEEKCIDRVPFPELTNVHWKVPWCP